MGRAKAQGLSWALVKFIHGMLDLYVAHGHQLPLFREVLANQAIGVLVQSALPRGIRMGEATPRIKVFGHAGRVTEFAAVVIGDGMNLVDMRCEPLRDCVAHGLGGTARITVWRDLRSTSVTKAPRLAATQISVQVAA